MANDLVTYTLQNGAAFLRMDDGKANALSNEMLDALLQAVDRAEREASAIVLAGRPDRFCAGFDLRVMMQGPGPALEMLKRGSDALMKLYGSPLPVVVACAGHALAGGALVLLSADLRLGVDGPYNIGLNEVGIGMPVPALAMAMARDRLLPTELARATLQAQIYTPVEAARVGYLDRIAPAGDLDRLASEEAARLGALSRPAYAATKVRLRGANIQQIRATLDDDVRNLLALGGG